VARIRVLLVDDHYLVRMGLALVVEGAANAQIARTLGIAGSTVRPEPRFFQ
jgi:DNA-binding NarL/FixJ family response regulator